MLATLLIAFREGIEAALIVGIVIGYLKTTGRTEHLRYAWAGVLVAIGLSVAFAALLQWVGAELEGQTEQIFEGTTMLIAVGVLTWMVYWMRYQARTLKSNLEREMHTALAGDRAWGVAAVTFMAVFREGIETALLLSAAAFAGDGLGSLLGAGLGLALAVFVGYLIYVSAVRLNLRLFFNLTSVLLLVFAAGMLALSVHEFQEAGLLFSFNEHMWSTEHLLSQDSWLGQMLKALLGYQSSPSLEAVVVYAVYWALALFGVSWWLDRKLARQNRPAQPASETVS